AITGTPSTNGAANFTVRATDAVGNIATKACTVTVYPALDLTNNYGSTAYTGVAFTGGTAPSKNAAKTPVSFVKAGGTIPSGLSLNSSTGAITGTPSGSGLSSFTIRGADALGNIDDIAHSITVANVPSVSNLGSAPKASNSKAYSFTLTGTGGVAPYTFSGT